MKTIETKITKSGVRTYYVDGKRSSREVALKAATDNREGNKFIIESDSLIRSFCVNGGGITESVYTARNEVKTLKTSIDSYDGRFTVYCGSHKLHVYCDKSNAKQLIAKIEDAFFSGADGCKITLDNEFFVIEKEFDASDYAISTEAFEEAIKAEIDAANNSVDVKIKALVDGVDNFDFGRAETNIDMYFLCKFVRKLYSHIDRAEIDGFNRAGFEFADDDEIKFAHCMEVAVGADSFANLHVAVTHDLNSISFNRRAIHRYINWLLTESTLKETFAIYLK